MKIKKYLPVLEYVSKLSPRQRKQFIDHASSDILLAISELCHNFNRGAIDVSQDQLKKGSLKDPMQDDYRNYQNIDKNLKNIGMSDADRQVE